jgi:hypothetical protein
MIRGQLTALASALSDEQSRFADNVGQQVILVAEVNSDHGVCNGQRKVTWPFPDTVWFANQCVQHDVQHKPVDLWGSSPPFPT